MKKYPNTRQVDFFSASMLDGGGKHLETVLSEHDISEIVAWFEACLGAPDEQQGECWVWQLASSISQFDYEKVTVGPISELYLKSDRIPEEDLARFRTQIIYEFYVSGWRWWQFWKR